MKISKPTVTAEKKSDEIPAAVITAAEVASPPRRSQMPIFGKTVLERLEDSNAP